MVISLISNSKVFVVKLDRLESIYQQDHLIDGLAPLWRGLRRIFGKYSRVE